MQKLNRSITEGVDATSRLVNYRKDGTTFWNQVRVYCSGGVYCIMCDLDASTWTVIYMIMTSKHLKTACEFHIIFTPLSQVQLGHIRDESTGKTTFIVGVHLKIATSASNPNMDARLLDDFVSDFIVTGRGIAPVPIIRYLVANIC